MLMLYIKNKKSLQIMFYRDFLFCNSFQRRDRERIFVHTYLISKVLQPGITKYYRIINLAAFFTFLSFCTNFQHKDRTFFQVIQIIYLQIPLPYKKINHWQKIVVAFIYPIFRIKKND